MDMHVIDFGFVEDPKTYQEGKYKQHDENKDTEEPKSAQQGRRFLQEQKNDDHVHYLTDGNTETHRRLTHDQSCVTFSKVKCQAPMRLR